MHQLIHFINFTPKPTNSRSSNWCYCKPSHCQVYTLQSPHLIFKSVAYGLARYQDYIQNLSTLYGDILTFKSFNTINSKKSITTKYNGIHSSMGITRKQHDWTADSNFVLFIFFTRMIKMPKVVIETCKWRNSFNGQA